MAFNAGFEHLQPYPFAKLRALHEGVEPPAELAPIALSLGEPKHPAPDFVVNALADPAAVARHIGTYPVTRGTDELREAIAGWLKDRFDAPVDPERECLPVNGTREALFAFAQAAVSGAAGARVLMPNPFYQIYEGAALLAGAQPGYVNNDPERDYAQLWDLPDDVWRETELVYVCSPGNPTGRTLDVPALTRLIELAHRHDFILAADECYAELYLDEGAPPPGLLGVSHAMGNHAFSRCIVFHSLSKRSNLPGLRSGFVAGDAELLEKFLLYRTYHGCAMAAHTQAVSAMAWRDETHVIANRAVYREKFAAVEAILAPHYPIRTPDGGFYHWLPVPGDDEHFARELKARQNVTVMPGSYLARNTPSGNPGTGHVRVAWVAELDACRAAAERLAAFATDIR